MAETRPTARRLAPPGRRPFVGRERELAALQAVLDGVAGEGGRVVAIEGEPGIGKTGLLQEFARTARGAGWHVLLGHAYDSEGMPPYLPFIEALREYAVAATDAALAAFVGQAPEVAALIPHLRARVPVDQERMQLAPGSERYRLFEAIRDWFADLASEPGRPGLVLGLEDLHWADESTLLLLEHLSRRLHETAIVLVLTYRDTELEPGRPLVRTIEQITRLGIVERLNLRRLDMEGMAALLAGLGGAPPPDRLVRLIYEETDGNPLFVQEVHEYLAGEGRLFDEKGRWRPDLRIDEAEVPQGVQMVIGGRLQRLSEGCRQALTVASAIGRTFDFDLLREVSQASEADLLDAMDEAEQAHLVTSGRALRGAQLMFTHELVRQTLASQLALPRRRALHLAVAEAIERLHAGNLGTYSAELAHHYFLGARREDLGKAIDYSLRAGEAAYAVFAYAEAAERWEAALELMARQASPGSGRAEEIERRARLLERLGDVMFLMDWQHGIDYLERGLHLYEDTGQVAEAARVHSKLGRCLSQFGEAMDIDRAVEHYRAAEAVLREGTERIALGHVYLGLASAAISSVRTGDGLAASLRAMGLAERLGNETLWASAATIHGWHVFAGGDVAEGLALMEHAYETADRLNSPAAFFAAWLRSELVELILQDPGDAPRLLHRELASPRLAHAPLQRRVVLAELGWALVSAGQLSEARRLLPDANPDWPLDAEIETKGNWELAEARFAAEQEKFRLRGDRSNQWRCCWWRGQVYRVWRRYEEAGDLFAQALSFFASAPHVSMEVAIRADLALLCAESGRADEAEPHLARCRQVTTNAEDWRGLAGRVALAEAAVVAAVGAGPRTRLDAGALQEAETHFRRAIDIFRRYTLPWDEAEALHLWGQALLNTRRRSAAIEKLDAAIEIYRRHGAGQPFIDRVEADRKRALGTAARPHAYPDSLTAREAEVLRLIAGGLSSKEIGQDLVLSVRTVERHIANIYIKTGTHGRAQATAYALAHALGDPTP